MGRRACGSLVYVKDSVTYRKLDREANLFVGTVR